MRNDTSEKNRRDRNVGSTDGATGKNRGESQRDGNWWVSYNDREYQDRPSSKKKVRRGRDSLEYVKIPELVVQLLYLGIYMSGSERRLEV